MEAYCHSPSWPSEHTLFATALGMDLFFKVSFLDNRKKRTYPLYQEVVIDSPIAMEHPSAG